MVPKLSVRNLSCALRYLWENFVDGQLSQLFAGGQTVLQLDLEADHSHAVPDVSFAGVSQLDFVLDALHGSRGRPRP